MNFSSMTSCFECQFEEGKHSFLCTRHKEVDYEDTPKSIHLFKKKPMKKEAKYQYLYEIPHESKIMCETSDGSRFIIFHHVDGMYSYCTTEKDNVIHIAASTQLKRLRKGVYEIDYEASR